ncbi:MAG: TlpA family protein disulfide reductase [Planctomycetota bacterium]|nr:MAG: TlpA family protein disulfide reductase [Planctomycetota bacterium]
MRDITRRTGGLDFLRPAFHRRRTPLQTTAVVRFRNNPDAWNELTVRVSEEPPQGLLDITLEPTRIGTPAPDWTLTTPNGETIRLRQLRGQVVVLEFWATWCAPCVAMLPALQRIHEAFRGKRVRVVGVNIWEHFGEQREGLAGFLKAHSVSYPTVIGNDDVVKAFQIRSIPALFVIDPAGRIAYVSYGMHSDRDYESDLRSLIRILLEGMSR